MPRRNNAGSAAGGNRAAAAEIAGDFKVFSY
jgi:hypothetical protein